MLRTTVGRKRIIFTLACYFMQFADQAWPDGLVNRAVGAVEGRAYSFTTRSRAEARQLVAL